MKRHVLTHRHTDLKDEFGRHPGPEQGLQRRLDAALDDNRMLREQVHALAGQLNLLFAEIDATRRRGSIGRR